MCRIFHLEHFTCTSTCLGGHCRFWSKPQRQDECINCREILLLSENSKCDLQLPESAWDELRVNSTRLDPECLAAMWGNQAPFLPRLLVNCRMTLSTLAGIWGSLRVSLTHASVSHQPCGNQQTCLSNSPCVQQLKTKKSVKEIALCKTSVCNKFLKTRMKLSNRVSPRNSDSNKGLRIELIMCYTEIKLKPFYKHIYITGGHIHLHGAGHLSPTSQRQLVPLQTPNKYQVCGSQPLTGERYGLNTCTHT